MNMTLGDFLNLISNSFAELGSELKAFPLWLLGVCALIVILFQFFGVDDSICYFVAKHLFKEGFAESRKGKR